MKSILLQNVTIIDGSGREPQTGMDVLVSEGRINADEPPGLALLRAAYHVRCTLEAGITTVRDLGGQAHMEFALRQAIAEGYCSGPRLVLAGKLLSMTSAGAEAF